MNADQIWNNEDPITNLDINVPRWIDQDISPYNVAAIVKGGCASGAYMPAVTYHQALDTMGKYGDDILNYLKDIFGETPEPNMEQSWGQMACFFVSCAVEAWATGAYSEMEEMEDAA